MHSMSTTSDGRLHPLDPSRFDGTRSSTSSRNRHYCHDSKRTNPESPIVCCSWRPMDSFPLTPGKTSVTISQQLNTSAGSNYSVHEESIFLRPNMSQQYPDMPPIIPGFNCTVYTAQSYNHLKELLATAWTTLVLSPPKSSR